MDHTVRFHFTGLSILLLKASYQVCKTLKILYVPPNIKFAIQLDIFVAEACCIRKHMRKTPQRAYFERF